MFGPAVLLSAVVFVPMLGAFALALLPRASKRLPLKATAVTIASFDLVLCLAIVWGFDTTQLDPQFEACLPWIPALGIHYHIGIDGISLIFVLITSVLILIALLGTGGQIETRAKEFVIFVLLTESAILGALTALDVFLFYIFWAVLPIPLCFFLGTAGGQRQAGWSAVKLFSLTTAGSLLLLTALIYMANLHGGWNLAHFPHRYTPTEQYGLFWILILAFTLRVPIVPLHAWLPDVYEETPALGALVLSNSFLNLSIYGLLRFCFPLFPKLVVEALPSLMLLGLISIVYGALVAWLQPHFKKRLAYASISYAGLCFVGLSAMTEASLAGVFICLVGYSLSAPALLFLANILNTQNLSLKNENANLRVQAPILTFFLGLAVFAHIGLPCLASFPGQLLILLGTLESGFGGPTPTLLTALSLMIASLPMLYWIQWIMTCTKGASSNDECRDLNRSECGFVAILMGLNLVVGLSPNFILSPLRVPIRNLVHQVTNELRATNSTSQPDTQSPSGYSHED